MQETTITLRVWPHESEVSFANQAIYAHYLELARWEWAVQAKVLHLLFREKILFILGGQVLNYRRPLKRFEKFTVKSSLVGWDSKWAYCSQKIFTAEGLLAHTAIVKFCYKGNEGIIHPQKIASIMGFQKQSPPLPEAVVKWIALEKEMRS